MKNLHPNNVFIKSDNPNDVLITDVGFADIPGIISNNESLQQFQAPELLCIDDPTLTVKEIADENPGQADIWSLGKIAMLLALGSPEHDVEALTDLELPDELVDFIKKCLVEDPCGRFPAKTFLDDNIFKPERIARLREEAGVFDDIKESKKDMIGTRIKAFSQASVLEQVMIGFVASHSQSQTQISRIRAQFDDLLKQQEDESIGQFTNGLKFGTVRSLLSEFCSKMEQDRILDVIDVDGDGMISFEEFQTAMVSSYSKKDTEMLESAFNKLDKNGDGFLDSNELAMVL